MSKGAASVLAAPGPWRHLVDTRAGNLKSGPFAPHIGFAIQIHPPSGSMFVRLAGTLTIVRLPFRSSLARKKTSPSFMSLIPMIFPFRRVLFPGGGFCCGAG